jgi:heat shock protein HslJ
MGNLKLMLLTIVLFIFACYPAAKEVRPIVLPTGTSSDENRLANTEWKLSSFGAAGAESPVVEGTTITLKFGPDTRANGSGGCNTYAGDYQVQGDTVSFSRIISTKKACVVAKVMQQENQYFEALMSSGKFKITENQLSISYDEGRGVLKFVKG